MDATEIVVSKIALVWTWSPIKLLYPVKWREGIQGKKSNAKLPAEM